MLNNRDEQVLTHILRHCLKVERTLDRVGRDFDIFVEDADFIDSVCLNIMQIGELAGSLSEEFISSTKDRIPWRAIVGMRNIIAHHYGTIEVDRMWRTALEDIPILEHFCEEQFQEISLVQDDVPGFGQIMF